MAAEAADGILWSDVLPGEGSAQWAPLWSHSGGELSSRWAPSLCAAPRRHVFSSASIRFGAQDHEGELRPFLPLWSPMEALYAVLEAEIGAFMEYVQQCQRGFDLGALYRVLLLVLPQSPSGELESWEHLQSLAKRCAAEGPNVASYVGWLASYLQHLHASKERFDAKVVFPLCENLYVHEEPGAPAMPPSPPGAPASIPCLATQLFATRRRWALLLRGDAIHEGAFTPQSLRDLQGFANTEPVLKVLRLVPDIFYRSLATAELARQWIRLHRNRYHIPLLLSQPPPLSWPPPRQPRGPGTVGPAPGASWPQLPRGRSLRQPSSPTGLPDLSGQLWPPEALRAQLQESQEELLTLLHHAERADALHAQICSVTQRIHGLRLQLRGGEPALEAGNTPGCPGTEELQQQLELEEYHQGILQADWLLELEVRPILVRHIEEVQQRCWDLERMLQGQALAVPPWDLSRSGATTISPLPTVRPMPAASPRRR